MFWEAMFQQDELQYTWMEWDTKWSEGRKKKGEKEGIIFNLHVGP